MRIYLDDDSAAGLLARLLHQATHDVQLPAGVSLSGEDDAFHLTRVPRAFLPGGRPVFRDLALNRTPEEVLARHALRPGPTILLDAAAEATLVTWAP